MSHYKAVRSLTVKFDNDLEYRYSPPKFQFTN